MPQVAGMTCSTSNRDLQRNFVVIHSRGKTTILLPGFDQADLHQVLDVLRHVLDVAVGELRQLVDGSGAGRFYDVKQLQAFRCHCFPERLHSGKVNAGFFIHRFTVRQRFSGCHKFIEGRVHVFDADVNPFHFHL